ncbi:hypothetical protein FA95DRAFT_1373471 [Auriscalpium vulgare]|uniref:Uncharacterized protein n=1 Tax=Auriscalpium vulgare TaxID=40419 RepID=A0ACB8RSB2_9AGAM|nr:hypothetical protein FA95DRAFT_1373471 [Auriscalpium vulgare]
MQRFCIQFQRPIERVDSIRSHPAMTLLWFDGQQQHRRSQGSVMLLIYKPCHSQNRNRSLYLPACGNIPCYFFSQHEQQTPCYAYALNRRDMGISGTLPEALPFIPLLSIAASSRHLCRGTCKTEAVARMRRALWCTLGHGRNSGSGFRRILLGPLKTPGNTLSRHAVAFRRISRRSRVSSISTTHTQSYPWTLKGQADIFLFPSPRQSFLLVGYTFLAPHGHLSSSNIAWRYVSPSLLFSISRRTCELWSTFARPIA